MQRRSFLQSSAALGLVGLSACASTQNVPSKAQVVVIGGGYGGATAARYLRLLSGHRIEVVLVEPHAAFVSCPLSNLVIGGSRRLGDITTPYTALARTHGVRIVRDLAQAVDTGRKTVTLARGGTVAYDMLVVSPGVDLQFDAIEGLAQAHASGRVLQAWKAGAETLALRRQLEAMPDGGTCAITVPEQPYRCPPGPYERACQVASYFKEAKPRSKVLVLDANPDIVSKGALFRRVWSEQYPGMIEYRPQHRVTAVDARAGVIRFDVQEDVQADVLNVLPPMRAGVIAQQAGLANMAGNRWCGIDYRTFESSVARDVYVLGDAIQVAPAMPKSAHMANNHAKVAAAAIVARLAGWPANPQPMLTNTCYSHVDATNVIHVASVHAYVEAEKTFRAVPGSGGVSSAANALEGTYAWNWARSIWADTLG